MALVADNMFCTAESREHIAIRASWRHLLLRPKRNDMHRWPRIADWRSPLDGLAISFSPSDADCVYILGVELDGWPGLWECVSDAPQSRQKNLRFTEIYNVSREDSAARRQRWERELG